MVLCQDLLASMDGTGTNATELVSSLETPYCVRIWGCGEEAETCPPRDGRVARRAMEDCTLFCEVSR